MNLRNIVVVTWISNVISVFLFFRIMNFVCVKLGPKYTILLLLLAFRTNDADSLWVRYSKWPVFGHSLYVILRCHFHMFWLFLHHYPQLWKKTKKYFSMIPIYMEIQFFQCRYFALLKTHFVKIQMSLKVHLHCIVHVINRLNKKK